MKDMRYLIRMESVEMIEERTNTEYDLLATIEDREHQMLYAVLFNESGYVVKQAIYLKEEEVKIEWDSKVKQQICSYLIKLYEEKEEELYQEEYLEPYNILDPNCILGIRTSFSSCLRSTGPPPVYCLGLYYDYFDLLGYCQQYS